MPRACAPATSTSRSSTACSPQGPLSRYFAALAVKKRTEQLLQLYADTIANEDKTLLPAISRDMLLRVYQGTAQADVAAERALDGVHPDLRAPKPFAAR